MQATPSILPMPILRPPAPEQQLAPDSEQQRRERAIKRIRAKNGFKLHLVAYLVVNAMFVMIWAITGAGYFWPIFVMAAWGVGVVLNGYTVYHDDTMTDAQIEREMQRLP